MHGRPTVPGVRKQGRPKMRWMDDMEEWAQMSFHILRETEATKEMEQNRLAHEATNPRNEDG